MARDTWALHADDIGLGARYCTCEVGLTGLPNQASSEDMQVSPTIGGRCDGYDGYEKSANAVPCVVLAKSSQGHRISVS